MNPITEPKIVEQRISICTNCEYKRSVMLMPLCSMCGCLLPAKIKLSVSKCPVGKW